MSTIYLRRAVGVATAAVCASYFVRPQIAFCEEGKNVKISNLAQQNFNPVSKPTSPIPQNVTKLNDLGKTNTNNQTLKEALQQHHDKLVSGPNPFKQEAPTLSLKDAQKTNNPASTLKESLRQHAEEGRKAAEQSPDNPFKKTSPSEAPSTKKPDPEDIPSQSALTSLGQSAVMGALTVVDIYVTTGDAEQAKEAAKQMAAEVPVAVAQNIGVEILHSELKTAIDQYLPEGYGVPGLAEGALAIQLVSDVVTAESVGEGLKNAGKTAARTAALVKCTGILTPVYMAALTSSGLGFTIPLAATPAATFTCNRIIQKVEEQL